MSRGDRQIPNYLVFAILTIFCCWPLAIPAIINAAKVNTLAAQGDYRGAEEASAAAKKWATIALGLGLIVYTIYCILQIFSFFIIASSR